MSERLSFEITLLEPIEGDDQWEANFAGISSFGDSGADALGNLGVQIGEIVEDAEYNRVHAPRIYGHVPSRKVPQVQRLHSGAIPQGARGKDPAPVHSPEPPQDRL